MLKNIKKVLNGGSNLHDEHEKLKIEVEALRNSNINYIAQLAKSESELVKLRKKSGKFIKTFI